MFVRGIVISHSFDTHSSDPPHWCRFLTRTHNSPAHKNNWQPSAIHWPTCATNSVRVNLRGGRGFEWSGCATAMMKSRCTSRPSLSCGLDGSIIARGKGCGDGTDRPTADLSGAGVGVSVAGVMMGLRMYSFIDLSVDGWNYVPSVAPRGAAFNPSWHLTAAPLCTRRRFGFIQRFLSAQRLSPAQVAELGLGGSTHRMNKHHGTKTKR